MGKRTKKTETKEIAPNWTVLKMKLKEKGTSSTVTSSTVGNVGKVIRRPQKSHKHLIKIPANTPAFIPKKLKFAEEIPIVGEEMQRGQLTKTIALDCEYVGVGEEGRDNALARVSIVNEEGQVVYDKYVKPKERVVDYRTPVSGIRPANLLNAEKFERVQQEVHRMLEGRIVVGHALINDFKVLALTHPRKLTRDTAKFGMLRSLIPNRPANPSLKVIAKQILGIDIQLGEHNSIIDARVALRVYLNMKKQWENEVKRFRK